MGRSNAGASCRPGCKFQPLFSISGAHIIHNCGNSVLSACLLFNEAVEPVSQVCKLIRSEHSCVRLRERCFSSRLGRQFHLKLNQFIGKPHKERWATCANALGHMVSFMHCIRTCWALGLYGNEDASCTLVDVDKPIRIDHFWGVSIASLAVYHVFKMSRVWADAYGCHWALDWDNAYPQQKAPWRKFKLRRLRLDAVSAGEFLKHSHDLYSLAGADLYLTLPANGRPARMNAFETGKTQMRFVFTLKLGVYEEPPLFLFASAHRDPIVSRRALRTCSAAIDNTVKYWSSSVRRCVRNAKTILRILGRVFMSMSAWLCLLLHLSSGSLANAGLKVAMLVFFVAHP